MTPASSPWLPVDALDDPRILRAIEPAASEWSAAWFARASPATLSAVVANPSGSSALGWREWRSVLPDIFVEDDEDAMISLALAAVDGPDATASPAGADRRLLRDFGERIVLDLARRMTKAWKIDGDSQASNEVLSGAFVTIDLRQASRIRLAVSVSALVPFRKSLIGSRRVQLLTEGHVTDGLGDAALGVSVLIGRAQLTGQELCALGVGDVLVLDRALGDPVPVQSERSGAVLGYANVEQDNGELQLKMVG